MRYIFGPVHSRRFGNSLGIDLSPDEKICNFDCLYCELKAAKTKTKNPNPPLVADIIEELKIALNKFKNLDVITITANGEPSLYENLNELIKEINLIKGENKTLILSNGTAVLRPEIWEGLASLDYVKFSLDSVNQKTFRQIDRSIKNYDLQDLVLKMSEFRKIFSGKLIMEVLVLEGFNDTLEEFTNLNKAFNIIKPDRIDISTLDRPPAYKKAKALSYEKLKNLAKLIKAAPCVLAHKKEFWQEEDLNKDELIKLLKLRPQSVFDVQNFSFKTKEILQDLVLKNEVIELNLAGTIFYRI